jgi:riboflavin synthase
MFTGIIERLGKVETAARLGGSLRLQLASAGFQGLEIGESIAVNGVCLTLEEFTVSGDLYFHVSPETIARTNLGGLGAGDRVNLERALGATARLSGHFVQGHVDGQARIARVMKEGAEGHVHLMEIEVPAPLARYCVEKGSVALDGISLTINSVTERPAGGARLGFTIIPHTWTATNLGTAREGAAVNVEVDVLAKYVEKLCRSQLPATP